MHSWTFCFAVQCFCKLLLATVGCLCLSASQHLHFLQMIALILPRNPPVPGPFFFCQLYYGSPSVDLHGSPWSEVWVGVTHLFVSSGCIRRLGHRYLDQREGQRHGILCAVAWSSPGAATGVFQAFSKAIAVGNFKDFYRKNVKELNNWSWIWRKPQGRRHLGSWFLR